MSKIKMLLDVVQDLRSLTDNLEALANVIEEPEGTQIDVVRTEPAAIVPEQTAESVPAANPQQTAEPQQTAAETAPAAPKPPTLVELRAFVAARSTPQTRPKIRALLAGHGVAKLTDLPESAYLDLMREVEAL
jgi:hypothetical protein